MMTTKRQVALPLILGAVGSLLIVSFISHGIAIQEFKWAVGTRDRPVENLPALTAYFHRLHGFWWVLPVVFGVFGIWLLIRPECRTSLLAWFLCVIAFVLTGWFSFFLVALYLVRTTFYMGP